MTAKTNEGKALRGLVLLGVIIGLGASEVPFIVSVVVLVIVGILFSRN